MKVFEPAMVDQLTGVGAQLGQRIANKQIVRVLIKAEIEISIRFFRTTES